MVETAKKIGPVFQMAGHKAGERQDLMASLGQTRAQLQQCYGLFNSTSEEELIDAYIFEINALQCRYNYLIRRMKELEEAI